MTYKDPEQQRAYQRAWLQRNRLEWVESQGSICAICGETEKPFEVDHVDPETKVSHRVWSWSKERREAELAKCQLLCEDCHWFKTGRENFKGNHGITGYDRGCKCDTCRTAKKRENARRYTR